LQSENELEQADIPAATTASAAPAIAKCLLPADKPTPPVLYFKRTSSPQWAAYHD